MGLLKITRFGFSTTCMAILMLVVLFVGCAEGKPSKETHKTHVVEIRQMKFDPATLYIQKGDTVVWINKDIVQHDVTDENDPSWTSGPLNKEQEWSAVIDKDLNYFCSIHVVMKGTISIQD